MNVRRCPDCGTDLGTAVAENALAGILGDVPVEIDVCARCGGAFFDRDEFGYVTGDMSLARAAKPVDGKGAFPCPGCGAEMHARQAHELRFSTCPKCEGTWFSGGEISRWL